MSGAKQPYYHKEFVLSTYKDSPLFFVKSFAVFITCSELELIYCRIHMTFNASTAAGYQKGKWGRGFENRTLKDEGFYIPKAEPM